MNPAISAKQILVVEDNPGDIGLIREVFGQETNVLWHFVGNVIQARNFLSHHPPYEKAPIPDLVIVDLRLPIYHGSILISEIKSNQSLKGIKVVAITGSGRHADLVYCLRLGADAAYFKPSAFAGWKSLVKNILK